MIESAALALPATAKFAVAPFVLVLGALFALDSTTITVTVIGAGQALILGYLGFRQQRGESKTEKQGQAVESTNRFVDQIQEQLTIEMERATIDRQMIADQARQLTTMQLTVGALELGIMKLTNQIVAEDLEPVWEIPTPGDVPARPGDAQAG